MDSIQISFQQENFSEEIQYYIKHFHNFEDLLSLEKRVINHSNLQS